MRNNKGISMITLIITIIVTIILLGLAYRIGTRYIGESKEKEKEAIVSIMSRAVSRRQNDNYIGVGLPSGDGTSGDNTYSGYHVSEEYFNELATLFDSSEDIYEPSLWYIVDAKNAQELGVVDADTYLVADIQNIEESDKGKFVALVDYYTGRVILLALDKVEQSVVIANITKPDGVDHRHKRSILSCTEPSVCIICGKVFEPALGHKFNREYATCTEDMKCVRCGYIGQKALGHDYDRSEWKSDATGHYHECKREFEGVKCGAKGDFEKHKISEYHIIAGTIIVPKGPDGKLRRQHGNLVQPEWKHEYECEVCHYTGQESCNFEIKYVDEYTCTWKCTDCGVETEAFSHSLQYREIDKEKHMVYCEYCNHELYEEEHHDVEKPYGRCDDCNALLDTTKKPQVMNVTMKKVTNNPDEYYLANGGDTVKIIVEVNMVLSTKPTIKLQNVTIKPSQIENSAEDTTQWVATVPLEQYNDLVDGILTIEVSNVRSVFGVVADVVDETSDGKYVDFDATLPVYEYLR